MKCKKPKIPIEQEKKLANEEWNKFLLSINSENINRDIIILAMQRINTIDYRLIKENKREYLG